MCAQQETPDFFDEFARLDTIPNLIAAGFTRQEIEDEAIEVRFKEELDRHLKPLAFCHSEETKNRAIEFIKSPPGQIAIWLEKGADPEIFLDNLLWNLRKWGTTRSNQHFSHPKTGVQNG